MTRGGVRIRKVRPGRTRDCSLRRAYISFSRTETAYDQGIVVEVELVSDHSALVENVVSVLAARKPSPSDRAEALVVFRVPPQAKGNVPLLDRFPMLVTMRWNHPEKGDGLPLDRLAHPPEPLHGKLWNPIRRDKPAMLPRR